MDPVVSGEKSLKQARNSQPENKAPEETAAAAESKVPDDQMSISSDYNMVSDIFNYPELKDLENFAIKRYKNATYKGQINTETRKREGFGVLLNDGGRVYEGRWVKDKKHGQGFETFKNGSQYRGNYEKGKPHGKGVYTWASGETYDGEFIQAVKQGYGVWEGLQGDSYKGEWKGNKASGFGVHLWVNGDKYEGEWQQSLKHGQGTEYFRNNDVYTGIFKAGRPEGYGQYKWNSGAFYVGEFRQGMKHGKGKWKKQEQVDNCNQYTGEYYNDLKHGQGQFNWQSGNYYVGGYYMDKRHGYGEMFWADGSFYKGDWEMGVQHGFGTIRLIDGLVKKGRFENNVYIAKVEDETKEERPAALPKPELEVLPEEGEEDMQGSRLGQIKPIEFGQNLTAEQAELAERKTPLKTPTKVTFDMTIQTDPEPKKLKEKGMQAGPSVKSKEHQTAAELVPGTPKIKMKDRQHQFEQKRRGVNQQTALPMEKADLIMQTSKIQKTKDNQTSRLDRYNKAVADKEEQRRREIETLAKQIDSLDLERQLKLKDHERELQDLERRLADKARLSSDIDATGTMIESDHDSDVVITQDLSKELQPLEPLKTLPPLDRKPVVVKAPMPPVIIKKKGKLAQSQQQPLGNQGFNYNQQSPQANYQNQPPYNNQPQRYDSNGRAPDQNYRPPDQYNNSPDRYGPPQGNQDYRQPPRDQYQDYGPPQNNQNYYNRGPPQDRGPSYDNRGPPNRVSPQDQNFQGQDQRPPDQGYQRYHDPNDRRPPQYRNQPMNTSLVMPQSHMRAESQRDVFNQRNERQPEQKDIYNSSRLGDARYSQRDMIMEPVLKMHIRSEVNSSNFLPKISNKKARSTLRPPGDSDSDSSTTHVDQMRRASKRAIHLLMRNFKQQQKSVWVPSGRQFQQGKIFHRNYNSRANLSTRS